MLYLDSVNSLWRKVFLMDAPKPRENHAIVKMHNEVYLFGGCSKTATATTVFEDFWKFDLGNV